MDSMLFIIAIFVSICISFGMVVIATTIRKLREEVNKLKDENHRLICSEHSLLWQRQDLRNEIRRLVMEPNCWGNLKDWMHREVQSDMWSDEYNKMEGANRVERLYQKAFDKHYKW